MCECVYVYEERARLAHVDLKQVFVCMYVGVHVYICKIRDDISIHMFVHTNIYTYTQAATLERELTIIKQEGYDNQTLAQLRAEVCIHALQVSRHMYVCMYLSDNQTLAQLRAEACIHV
jgi:hypothetical protein